MYRVVSSGRWGVMGALRGSVCPRMVAGGRVSYSSDGKALQSFTAGLFCGEVREEQCFPYPSVLTEEDREFLPILVDSTTRFFEEKNDALANDLTKTVPDEGMVGLKELGMFGLQVPNDYGGIGLKNTGYARLTEVIGSYDLAVGIVLGAHQSIGFKGILIAGNEEQKARYLPDLASGEKVAAFCLTEPGSGSDAQSIKTRAVQNPDGSWTLNGGKVWISNGGFAEVFTVFAQTEVVDGKTGEKKDKVTAFIVERSFGGVTNGPPEDKMGIRASNTAEVHFENVPIPAENVLGEVGKGFKVAMQILNNGRFGMGSTLAGTCKKLIGQAVAHATERKQFGKVISDFGMVQEKIAHMTMRTYALESMAYLVSSVMDQGSSDYQLEAAVCKVYGTETAWYVADETLQILAGMGYMRETGVEKIVRDLRIFRIFEGTNEILRLLIALTGVQQKGAELKELQKVLKSPLKNAGFIFQEGAKRLGHLTGMGGTADTLKGAHPELASSAKLVATGAAAFGAEVEKGLMHHKKDIVDQQMLLRRYADVSIHLYSMAATIARASRALSEGLPSASHEKDLAEAFCKQGQHHVNTLLDEIRGKNVDAMATKIAQTVCANEGYKVSSPIGLDM